MEGQGGAWLRAALVPAPEDARGSVVLSSGRAEPLDKYWEVAGELRSRGFAVLLHDWRGQGLSQRGTTDPLAGHAAGWRPFLADYARVIAAYRDRLPKPWIAMGHSMGGGLTALALLEGEAVHFAGAVLSAPMLGVKLGGLPPWAVTAAAAAMALIGRGGSLIGKASDPLRESFEGNQLTSDRGRWERFSAQLHAMPELRIGGPTWGWAAFAVALQRRVARPGYVEKLALPLTVVSAGEERLVQNDAARRFAERAQRGRYVEVPGALHEILMETDDKRAVFWRAFDELAERVAPVG